MTPVYMLEIGSKQKFVSFLSEFLYEFIQPHLCHFVLLFLLSLRQLHGSIPLELGVFLDNKLEEVVCLK